MTNHRNNISTNQGEDKEARPIPRRKRHRPRSTSLWRMCNRNMRKPRLGYTARIHPKWTH